jgi:hypothetical protein
MMMWIAFSALLRMQPTDLFQHLLSLKGQKTHDERASGNFRGPFTDIAAKESYTKTGFYSII